MRRLFLLCCALLCMFFCTPEACALQAEEISGKSLVVGASGVGSVNRLFDGRTMESLKIKSGGHLTLSHEAGIGSVYLVFGEEYGPYTVTDEAAGERRTFGETGFLHEFLNLEEAFGYVPQKVTISFESTDAKLAELWAFTSGQVPEWVQQWEASAQGEADLVLFSTHGDDEQLFFAGMLPYYAVERGYNVQVVYMTDHRNMTVRRSHEMLDGLWAVGIRKYPVFGPFGDYNSTSLAGAYQIYRNKNISREDILSFVVENVRRFRPKVAVGHDLNGEYGHGMHMIYAELLCEAVNISADGAQFPESAERYGTWDVPKTYLHLYPQNEIILDWDIPLERFDGLTAFEVTKELGFPCHVSQQSYYSWFFAGMDSAAEIPDYSPCEFGLYRSTVGDDVQKNDFFEHMTTHAEDVQLEAQWQAQEQARLERERLEAEELAREATRETEPLQTEPLSKSHPEPEADAGVIRAVPVISSAVAIVWLFAQFFRIKGKKKER